MWLIQTPIYDKRIEYKNTEYVQKTNSYSFREKHDFLPLIQRKKIQKRINWNIMFNSLSDIIVFKYLDINIWYHS